MSTHNEVNAATVPDYGDSMPVAIIGAGCRMPRAADIFEYWRRLADGEELIDFFDAEQLAAAGVDPALLKRPGYVPAAAVVAGADRFDWGFFGYSRHEAESIDPQQRLFLMCAWEALEMAGHAPAGLAAKGDELRIGVIGACKMSSYPAASFDKMEEIASPSTFARLIGNDKDYLATRVSYKLGLTGPSMTVQTACSSSLVAIHLACEQIASGECDMVLAGGAGIGFPQESGYVHREGMIFSRDGHCRPFDADAGGTTIGNGVGVVLLKSLGRALADGDPVLAIVRGSAVNNDGAGKAGYTAPSPEGQARVISEALLMAEVDPASIGLVEAHGTATPLGDPIEVEALTRAWRRHTSASQYCALGSVKSNLGHLDTAAGVASFLKAAMALHFGQVPPSLHFEQPNPAIDFENSPFFVPQMLLPWPVGKGPRRAAVSAFAIGGTNCHTILEQAPPPAAPAPADNMPVLLLLSARSDTALKTLALRHAWRLCELSSDQSLADYCATSVHHRSLYGSRLALLANDVDNLISLLYAFVDGDGTTTAKPQNDDPHVWIADALTPDAGKQSLIDFVTTQLGAGQPVWDGHAVCAVRPITRALLPTCPFEGERCWYTKPGTVATSNDQHQAWQAMRDAGHHTAAALAAELDLSALARENEGVDALHAFYVGRAFATLGIFDNKDEWMSVDACLRVAGAPARFHQLFARLLRDHADAGLLEKRGVGEQTSYRHLHADRQPDPQPWLGLMRDLGYRQLADLVERTGPRLADMLAEKVDAVGVVFPGAATDEVEHMYQDQPYSVYLNHIAAATVAGMATAQGRPLRILEVGGGTGGTTRDVLAQLPADACELYTFTDLGPLFLQKARKKFAAYPFMRFQGFDMNGPAGAQGLAAGGYDLIIAANVLHNAPDLRVMLANLATILAPGGVLLMREITAPKKLFDFVFGPLVPALSDSEKRDGELFASRMRWQQALSDAGFSHTDAMPAEDLPTHALGEQILLARRPATTTNVASTSLVDLAPAKPDTGHLLTIQKPTIGNIIKAILAWLPEPAGCQLEQMRWHLDIGEAPAPLQVTLSFTGDHLRATVDDTRGHAQALLTATVARPRALRRHYKQGAEAMGLEPADDSLLDRVIKALSDDPSLFVGVDSLYWPAAAESPPGLRLHISEYGAVVCDATGRVQLDLRNRHLLRRPAALPSLWRGEGDAQLFGWQWQKMPAAGQGRSLPRRVLYISDDGQQDFKRALGEAGVDCGLLPVAELMRDKVTLVRRLELEAPFDTVVYQPASVNHLCDAVSLFEAAGITPLVNLMSALSAMADVPALIVISPHAYAITAMERCGAWPSAGMGALLAVARQEMPALHCSQLDTGDAGVQEQVHALLTLLGDTLLKQVPVLALRNEALYCQRLTPTSLPAAPPLPQGRHVLIGGLCELGLELAHWLVASGARDLIWLTRRAPDAKEKAALDSLLEQGVTVHVDSDADVTDPEALTAALQRLAEGPPLGIVFHLAGVVNDAPLSALQPQDWEASMATKLRAALRQHALEVRLQPVMTVYFSSAASAFGPAGQGSHALANAMLEGLAEHRSRAGHDTLALAWGFWREIESEKRQGLAARLAERGMLGMSSAQGWALLAAAMGGNASTYMPCHVDWNRFATQATPAQQARFGACWKNDAPLAADTPRQMPAQQTSTSLLQQLLRHIADLLGCPVEQLNEDSKLVQMGMDSLLMLDLAEQLKQKFDLTVSADTLFKADTPKALAAALQSQMAGQQDPVAALLHAESTAALPAAQRYLRSRLAGLLQCAEADMKADTKLVELGLDSLLFLELSETIQQELHVKLSAEVAFQGGSITALARILVDALHPGVDTSPRTPAMTGLRRALLELEQRDGGWLASNGDVLPRPSSTEHALTGLRKLRWRLRANDLPQQLYVEFDKPGDFDLAGFERAWQLLLARHAALRTTVDAQANLHVTPKAPYYAVRVNDLRGLPAGRSNEALAELREEMTHATSDLQLWPHFDWRASKIRLNNLDLLRIHLRMDTTLTDIESFRIMLRELHLWVLDPLRRLPSLQFSANDYYACEQALATTTIYAKQLATYGKQLAGLPPGPSLPRHVGGITSDGYVAVWRDALPRTDWLALKATGAQAGLTGTAVMLAAYATAIAACSERSHFSLRLDYPDRKPLHAQIGNVMLDASDTAMIGCHADAASFMALAHACDAAIQQRLDADVVDGASVMAAYRTAGTDRPAFSAVAMTSLLGVRTTYAIPETSDPLLGMPAHETATQPGTALHFQVLEEESALLYNIDLHTAFLPQELGNTLMRHLGTILQTLAASPAAWTTAPKELLRESKEVKHG
ncbi:beta-ketoacyl synthase N-terminal-like domain-containing protein [Janthinobacterium sp. SUN073]|uniref:beta-ketoacyl synthase N-terminal-like domain-containing protein n=1 Tax=Janthinobacterium sp. SUN073 TaxID=3004102 RepID=UPI0025B0ACC2|nr:beta-ketoacyl synthase N-terminal-like domain-containing protein [Janthinobacterium sp. SUN073]MDN2697071.1 beta-ketoacyl synthase N-terminal-like domain-containing protein [Janthinobacterium sp. SUN073]